MSLIKWKPAHELIPFPSDVLNIQRGINRMFDNFFRGGVWDEEIGSSAWTPAVDVTEHDNDYFVKVELPGVERDDVKITTQDNILTIRGEKKQEKESNESSFHMVERSYGSFQRSFTLPGGVRNDRIEASFRDGILEVTLPKAEEAKSKMVEVKVR